MVSSTGYEYSRLPGTALAMHAVLVTFQRGRRMHYKGSRSPRGGRSEWQLLCRIACVRSAGSKGGHALSRRRRRERLVKMTTAATVLVTAFDAAGPTPPVAAVGVHIPCIGAKKSETICVLAADTASGTPDLVACHRKKQSQRYNEDTRSSLFRHHYMILL